MDRLDVVEISFKKLNISIPAEGLFSFSSVNINTHHNIYKYKNKKEIVDLSRLISTMTFQQFQDNFDRVYEYLPWMLGSFIFYCLLCCTITASDYLIGKYYGKSPLNLHKRSTNKAFLIGNHMTSLLFSVQFTLFSLTYHNPLPTHWYDESTKYTKDYDRINFAIIAGYFVYDTLALSIHMLFIEGSRADGLTLFHHFWGTIANIYAITQDIDGYFMIQGTLCLESSGPYYHMYRIIQHTKYDLGIINLLNNILFFTSYTFTRICIGSYLAWFVWYYSKAAYCQILGNVGVIVSVIWYKEIVAWLYHNVINPPKKNVNDEKKQC